MKQRSFMFVVGDDPYKNSHGEREGNGTWHTSAATVDEALQIIFGGMDFPGEATGRKIFVPGTSLEGCHEDDVIQVWCDDPAVHDATLAALKGSGNRDERGGLHSGRGNDFGLACEVKVTDLDKYCNPVRTLLKAPEETGAPAADVSPMGASVIRYHAIKHEIKLAAQQQKMEVTRKKWEIEKVEEDLEAKMKQMQQQIAVFDAYLHGTRRRKQIARGKRSTGKYMVYQKRVFLSEEISLLGNFQDMDFKDMEKFESWLVKSGHIWKMLPHERCILATRIRQERKDYGDPLANIWNNLENMQNMIWIRDGENVFHIDVEFDFNNAVFPRRDQFDLAKTVVQDHLFLGGFKVSAPKNWHGERLKPGEYDVMGEMRRKPLEESEPYYTRRNLNKKFSKMADWLADPECYTELLDKQINDAIHEYLRESNKSQMLFAVIVQGIVDNTSYLDIPKGTDMFNWESVNTYLELLYDYSHGLPYQGWADKVETFVNGNVAVGDWIVAYVDEYISSEFTYGSGVTYTERHPMLFKVLGLEDISVRTHVGSGQGDDDDYKFVVTKKPVVRYHPKAKRWLRSYGSYENYRKARQKAGITLTLKNSEFIRVPMSPQYAKDILNDREWKKTHVKLVPLMVNYDCIIKAMKTPVNGAILEWAKQDE